MINEKTFTMYYNDDPEIVRSWFAPEITDRITIKHTKRERDVSGTKIREAIEKNDTDYLKEALCPCTYYVDLGRIKDEFKSCNKEDYMMN